MSKARQIYDETFTGIHMRSDEFRAGCLHILVLKLDNVLMTQPKFEVPSPQLDAWMWGCEYGHELAASAQEAAQA